MDSFTRTLRGGFALVLLLTGISCGGGSDSGSGSSGPGPVVPASNVVSVIVDSGPAAAGGTVNTLYTTVTLCVPGSTTQCQTIDHIQVDTGSYGFRVLASVLSLGLPITQASNGNSVLECTQFVDGYSWGPIAAADIQIAGETARSVPIQVIGDSAFSVIPPSCSGTSGTPEDTVTAFGANGILGIGVFEQDCGMGCATNAANGDYYSCNLAGTCTAIAVPLASQVQNPVPLFAADNNGTFVVLPAVASPGAATVTGSLIFGIDTQTNNVSGRQNVLTVDPNDGNFTTDFTGQTLSASFLDTGTNGIFFNDSSITPCTSNTAIYFYCPASMLSLSGTLVGQNGVSATASFTVDNADTLTNGNPTLAALPSLAGNYSSSAATFDWGLPFYFGRVVATAIENHTTAVDTGPYVAF